MSRSQQSPINLHDPIYAELRDEALGIHWNGVIPGHAVKDEHGLKVQFAPDHRQFIRLGGKPFHLASFHFHHPSEHWVEGEQHTVELHVVHQNVNDGSLAVIGIFIEVGEPVGECPALVTQLKAFLGTTAEPESGGKVVADPSRFLPENTEEYYRYEGSLTTPEFSENVSWVVLRTPFFMAAEDIKALIVEFEKPARFPEPLNRRFVLATFRPDGSAEARSRSRAAPEKSPRPRAKGRKKAKESGAGS